MGLNEGSIYPLQLEAHFPDCLATQPIVSWVFKKETLKPCQREALVRLEVPAEMLAPFWRLLLQENAGFPKVLMMQDLDMLMSVAGIRFLAHFNLTM